MHGSRSWTWRGWSGAAPGDETADAVLLVIDEVVRLHARAGQVLASTAAAAAEPMAGPARG